jgi:NADP-dependent 3-hydroxy acid dehydrogenase YdfG
MIMKLEPRPAIEGKVAIITGASAGIGEATAREFARAGARVVLAARRKERLERLEKEIQEMGGTALAVRTDVTDVDQVANLVETTFATFGRIDMLANIAGWALYDWLEELSPEDLRKHYDVNVIGMAELTRQVIPIMKKQRSGYILNMSSYASRISIPPLTVYASTKYAVEGLTDGLRRELLPWGIEVMRIHPSAVTGTEFNKRVVKEGGVKYRSLPLGRISREDLATMLVELVEKPRRALFVSRLYEPGVFLNRNFPQIIDWIMGHWVRRHRKNEFPRSEQIEPARYYGSLSLLPLLGGILAIAALLRRMRKKS